MLNFNKDHKALVLTALGVFLFLSIGVAIFPAFQMEAYTPFADQPIMTADEIKGQNIYIAEGCVGCHTQQVRNIEMDKMWGNRPSVAEDYFYSKQRPDVWRQTASVLGSERTGPDLTDIGKRQPSLAWQLLHLYNPRAVVKASIMPSFPWLFKEVDSVSITKEDVAVAVPKEYFNKPGKKIIASEDALYLVAYLQSLKQQDLPEGVNVKFIPFAKKSISGANQEQTAQGNNLNGHKLFMNTCAACHQETGKGVSGAFPPLAGSETVNNADPTKMISIILMGYDQLPGYGAMPGFGDQLTDEEIAAIATHERSSWGNTAAAVKIEDVKKVRDSVMQNLK